MNQFTFVQLFLPILCSFVQFNLMKRLAFLFIASVLMVSCETQEEITLRDKIGSMLIVGFRGTRADNKSKIATNIKKHNLGGVILFNSDPLVAGSPRNIKSPKQLTKLTTWLQGLTPTPLFVAIDQEGGFVSRLNQKSGFPKTLSAYESYQNPEKFHKNNATICTTLKKHGINLNFAPVVDVGVNPKNFIYKKERIYSSKPLQVVHAASLVIKMHHQHNLLTAIKHFPGHGSSKADSHKGFADVSKTWDKQELIPFAQLSAETDMIMTSHIYHKGLDLNYPATLSKKVITGLLRNKLGYQGVVISDDLGMKAISSHYSLRESVVLAINAGVDILLFANTMDYNENVVEEVIDIVLKEIELGAINEKLINGAYVRIQKLRSRISK